MQLDETTVALLPQTDYEHSRLAEVIDRLLLAIGGMGCLRTARVVLKPNLITTTNCRLACTDHRFIVGVARWFLDQGARVSVGDSPAFGSAQAVLAAIGALEPLRNMGVAVAEFKQTREVALQSGQTAAMAIAALDCDLLVNLPKIKAHSQMRVTMAVKNYFGCLVGWHKPWWHMLHGGAGGPFARLLVELLDILPRSVSVVDGIVAMHVEGPIHGQSYPLGVVAGGSNPVALDTALLALLQIDPSQSPLWLAADQSGIKGTRTDVLHFPLATPGELAVEDFVVPGELGPVRFNPVRFAKNSLKRMCLRLASD